MSRDDEGGGETDADAEAAEALGAGAESERLSSVAGSELTRITRCGTDMAFGDVMVASS